MTSAPAIDVSKLPPHTLDHRSPIWWANTLLLCIETTAFALLVASYFYLRMNFTNWPPVRAEKSLYATNPDLGYATANLLLLLVSVVPMFWADRAALHRRVRGVQIAMVLMVVVGLGTILLRFYEFSALKFYWDENAYAGVVWAIVGMHLLHLITGTAENGIMAAWTLSHGLDDQHARDVRVGAVYWYWIAAVWVPLYTLVYFVPRWL
jgi:cytochrome c oxidase subunit III